MRKYLMAAAVALSFSGVAHAANPTLVFTDGVYAITNSNASVFEDFSRNGAAPDGGATFAKSSMSPYGESANNATVFPGSKDAIGTAVSPGPAAPNDNYLAIGSDGNFGQFSVDFGAGVQYFSFVLGSLDSYNTLTLNFADGDSRTYNGLGIINGDEGVAAGGTPTSYGQSGRLSVFAQGGSALTGAVFSSTQAAFEIDSLAAAVPEPGTWLMMILGFGLIGGTLRVRRRKVKIAYA